MKGWDGIVQSLQRQREEHIEKHTWIMLDPEQNPHRYGLMVIDSPMKMDGLTGNGTDKVTASIETKIGLHPDVPFGEIHYKRGKADE